MDTKNLTIMFTDMKGFTRRTSGQSRSATVDMIREHKAVLGPVIEGHGGKLIKTIGDAFLVTFESPTDAVLTGIALQSRLREHNTGVPEKDRVEIRVAINTGEVAIEEGDVYGEAVNIAARIEGIAEANEIYFTEATYLAMNKSEVPSAEIGYRVLKGIPQKIKVYRVLREGETPPAPGPEIVFDPSTGAASIKTAPVWKRAVALAIDFFLVLLAVALLTWGERSRLNRRHTDIRAQMRADGIEDFKNMPEGHPLQQTLQQWKGRRDKLNKASKGIWNVIFVLYVTTCVGWKGKTAGKRVMGLKVVCTNGAPPGFKKALLRCALYYLSALPLLLGFIWAFFDSQRLAWHDKISDTAVIHAG